MKLKKIGDCMKNKLTKKAYEEELNLISEDLDDDSYWMGGKLRLWYKYQERYGYALRRYDSIAFEVGYREWVENKNLKEQ